MKNIKDSRIIQERVSIFIFGILGGWAIHKLITSDFIEALPFIIFAGIGIFLIFKTK